MRSRIWMGAAASAGAGAESAGAGAAAVQGARVPVGHGPAVVQGGAQAPPPHRAAGRESGEEPSSPSSADLIHPPLSVRGRAASSGATPAAEEGCRLYCSSWKHQHGSKLGQV